MSQSCHHTPVTSDDMVIVMVIRTQKVLEG